MIKLQEGPIMAKLLYCFRNPKYRDNLYVAPHFHRIYELVYYLSGRGFCRYNLVSYPVIDDDGTSLFVGKNLNSDCASLDFQENSFIVYPPYVTHDERHIGDGGSVVIVGFQLDENEAAIPPIALKDSSLLVKNYLFRIIKENKEKPAGYALMVNYIFSELVIHLGRMLALPKQSNLDIIHQAVEYIDNYFTSGIDLVSLAQSIGYNLDYFRHLFRKVTGVSPKQYIQEKRIALAKQSLMHIDIPLQEIAINCGYDDYPQFSTYFKKKTLLSPSEYRAIYSNHLENK